ncbi:MAG: retroviral-like aspartic protease family protein [Burkholderiales bacterium]|nr:retroviral-like aspartic protease family protein [Burkholderiales bacterium]
MLAGALAALAQAAAAAPAPCKLALLELPVKMVGVRAIATVGINGKEVPLVVDSGAFFSFLTESAAAQLNLSLHPLPFGMNVMGLTGRVKARATTVDSLELLKGKVPDVEFVVGGNEDVPGTMGLMGRNLLSFTDTEYDLAHGMIRFVFPKGDCGDTNMAYWAGDMPVVELALHRDRSERTPAIRATIEVNGRKTSALFDTGASTALSLSAAHRAGVKDADMTPDGRIAGAGTRTANAWIAPVDKVDFGGEAINHNKLAVADFEMEDADMLVGIDFFLSHRIYVSKRQSRMYFTYNGGPVFALNKGENADIAAADAAASAATAMTADAYARRGAASQSRHDFAGALADLDRACALEPANAVFLATRARLHLEMKAIDKAFADLDAALHLDPGLGEARMTRAVMRETAGQRAAALADLAVLERTLAPQSDLRRGVASLYGEMNLPAMAIAQWDQWLPTHRNDIGRASALNSRCWMRVEMGTELDKALDDCDDAIDADSKNASFLDSRAWVYLRQGKFRKSLDDFDDALKIDPGSAYSLYGRGQVHLALGHAQAGEADLAAARRRQPEVDAHARLDGLPTAPSQAASGPVPPSGPAP